MIKQKKNQVTKTPNILLALIVLILVILMPAFASAENQTTKAVTGPDAWNLIFKIEKTIASVENHSIPTIRFADAIADMKSKYESGDYAGVSKQYAETVSLLELATITSNLIDDTKIVLEEANHRDINISEPLYYSNIGLSQFTSSNFESAHENLEKSHELIIKNLENETAIILETVEILKQNIIAQGIYNQQINNTYEQIKSAKRTNDIATIFTLTRNLESINASTNAIQSLKQEIALLEQEGYSTKRLNENLAEIESYFEVLDTEELLAVYNTTTTMMQLIRPLAQGISSTEASLLAPELAGIDFSQATYYLNLSKNEFNFENYERSEELLKKAKELKQKTEQEHLFQSIVNKAKMKFNILEAIKNNWLAILLVIIIGGSVLIIVLLFIKHERLKSRIVKLDNEHKITIDMMKKNQSDYYKEKTIDKETYKTQQDDFEKRIYEIQDEIPLLHIKVEKNDEMIKNIKNIKNKVIKGKIFWDGMQKLQKALKASDRPHNNMQKNAPQGKEPEAKKEKPAEKPHE
ncbi:hypothetical protein JW756_05905 [Candidatus Woesearchaeota archaeon]|nr:hypothetical protein [Candidatus Woesearchaeota archaeon]